MSNFESSQYRVILLKHKSELDALWSCSTAVIKVVGEPSWLTRICISKSFFLVYLVAFT